tara:strand:- start:12 stop:203 length:192 start_codon:yes stop_codon:yes gene_type:complete
MDEIERERFGIEMDREKTQLKKEQFIREIKNGLGEHIKKNGNKVKKIKISKWENFWLKLKKIF